MLFMTTLKQFFFFRICFLLHSKLIAYLYDWLLIFYSFLHIDKCNHYTNFKCLYFSYSLFVAITISHSTIHKLLHTLKAKLIEPSHSKVFTPLCAFHELGYSNLHYEIILLLFFSFPFNSK